MTATPLPILSSRGFWEFDVALLDANNQPVLTTTYDSFLLEFRTGPNALLIDSCSTANVKIVPTSPATNALAIKSHTADRTINGFVPAAKVTVFGDLIGFVGSDDFFLGRIEFIADPTVTRGPHG
jgi:hypothetical protein